MFDPQVTTEICEAFSRHQEHRLLEAFANAARKRWPQQPIFVYHAVAARFAKEQFIASERDYDDLEQAQAQAHKSKDLRLTMRIDALFEDDAPEPEFDAPDFTDQSSPPGFSRPPFDMAAMNPEVFRTMVEQSFKFDGGASFLKQARKDLGDVLYRQIEKECAGKRPLFLSRILDLVCATLGPTLVRPPRMSSPRPVPTIIKPTKPVEGQGSLFNE